MKIESLGDWEDVGLAGESQTNKDGSSRQDELRLCSEDDEVELVREPDNPHDPNAILVVTERGVGIGYIPAAIARKMAPLLDSGASADAYITSLMGGTKTKPHIGAWIEVSIYRYNRQAKGGGCLGGLVPLLLVSATVLSEFASLLK